MDHKWAQTRRCGAERPNLCVEMRKKANFVSFLVDRSKIFIKMRSAEVGAMIFIVFSYYLRRAKRGGAENDIFPLRIDVIFGPTSLRSEIVIKYYKYHVPDLHRPHFDENFRPID